ncbi:MAG: diaminopimelate decarboxylase [Elusimicrobia bacterium]|nr:diaminopimelate decarboxylase [Elusimicrobiota bacterium]
MEGVSVRNLADRFGTPLYVYSEAAILSQIRRFEAAFSGLPHLFCYALKANPSGRLCRLISSRGLGADIVSGGEMERALRSGFPASRIIFSGVGKTESELKWAVRRRLLFINVESEEELRRLEGVAKRLNKTADISVRVNPDIDPRTHRHITTGLAVNKFGVPPAAARDLFRRAAKRKHLRPVAIQCHLGSQIREVKPYLSALRQLLSLARSLAADGIPLRWLDIGGGMGVAEGEKGELNPETLAAAIASEMGANPLRLILEPGRALVAGSGALLMKVLYRKASAGDGLLRGPRDSALGPGSASGAWGAPGTRLRRGRGGPRFVIVDAGMNDFARPSLYDAQHPIVPAVLPRGGPKFRADVVGPICETGDFVAKDRLLPWPAPGDVWALLMAGAYGFSMSSQYNSRPRAAEVLVSGQEAVLIRRRETLKDLFALER